MHSTIFTFLAIAIFFATPAFAQVKQWTDKNGVVHFEAIGRQGAKNTNPPQTKTNALRPIDRSFATLRLGDDESTFTGAKKGVQIANNGDGGNFYSYSSALPEGANNMGVLFNTGRLAAIMIEYRDFDRQDGSSSSRKLPRSMDRPWAITKQPFGVTGLLSSV